MEGSAPEDGAGLSRSIAATSCWTACSSEADAPQARLTAPSALSRVAPDNSSHLGDSGSQAYEHWTKRCGLKQEGGGEGGGGNRTIRGAPQSSSSQCWTSGNQAKKKGMKARRTAGLGQGDEADPITGLNETRCGEN